MMNAMKEKKKKWVLSEEKENWFGLRVREGFLVEVMFALRSEG